MTATLPLALAALLSLASGLVKLRAAGRVGLGVHPPSLAEVLAGLGLAAAAATGALAPAAGLGAVVAGVVLTLASSLHFTAAMARRRRLRALTEGRRLQAFVGYVADARRDGEGGRRG